MILISLMDKYLYTVEQHILCGLEKNLKNIESIDNYIESLILDEPPNPKKDKNIFTFVLDKPPSKEEQEKYPIDVYDLKPIDHLRLDKWKVTHLIRQILSYNALYGVNFIKINFKMVHCGHWYNVSYIDGYRDSNEFKTALHNYEIIKGYKTIENDTTPEFWLFYPNHNFCSKEAKDMLELYEKQEKTDIIKLLDIIRPYYGRNCCCYNPRISILELDEFNRKKRELELEKNKDNHISFGLHPEHYPSGGSSGYILCAQLTTKMLTLEQYCINKLKQCFDKNELCKMYINQDIKDKYFLS